LFHIYWIFYVTRAVRFSQRGYIFFPRDANASLRCFTTRVATWNLLTIRRERHALA